MNRPTLGALSEKSPRCGSAEGGGFEPPVREPVRQFSKLLVSATHPSFQKDLGVRNRGVISLIAGAKVRLIFEPCKFLSYFFRFSLIFLRGGAINGTRTRDPRLGKPMLYQLSYYRLEEKRARTEVLTLCGLREPIAGLEPATHALRMRCSTN